MPAGDKKIIKMPKLFDLSAIKLTRAQGAHALELINQNIKFLALTPQSIRSLEQLAKALLAKPAADSAAAGTDTGRPEDVLNNFDLTSLRFSAAQCFKTCQLFLDNADVLELDVDQASVVDEFSQEFANAESEVESQEEEAEVYEKHVDELECTIVNENRRKVCRLYLIGECPFEDLCPLRHPSKEELDKLYSYYASIPCRNFDRCKLKNCLYQHPGGPVKGSIQDQYIRRVVKGGRSTICFKFLSGICDQTAEQCDKLHANADEAAKTIQKCRASTCKNGPECRVAGCLFNHSGYPVWYVPKSRDSVWWGRGWDEELENEKKEIQFWYEGKLREAADYYETKLQELDDWYSAKCRKMEDDIQCLECKDEEHERTLAQQAASYNTQIAEMQAQQQKAIQEAQAVSHHQNGYNAAPLPTPAGGKQSTVIYVDAQGRATTQTTTTVAAPAAQGNQIHQVSREEWGERSSSGTNAARGAPAEYGRRAGGDNKSSSNNTSSNTKSGSGAAPKEFLKPAPGKEKTRSAAPPARYKQEKRGGDHDDVSDISGRGENDEIEFVEKSKPKKRKQEKPRVVLTAKGGDMEYQ
ncbi:unnamed protein product [Amoebophrya sp. A25]|nr:unnamed protein product [Amoebophrya sp. A25]|eukprot:GSA25T00022681001.1